MEVYAYTSRERSTLESRKDDSYCVRGTGDPNGLIPTKWFHGSDKSAINEFLDQHLDLLVICLPLTESTRHLISEEQFQILSKQRTFVSNVGRGPHINTVDLIKALEKGQIRGAALDVTDPEPLPSDHPLWKAPNLLVTPHVSWQTKKYWDRVMEILEGNLARLSEGQPLMNLVNRMYNY
jgi:phosphoglycerate dehydrogenase-like enzyme